MNVNDLPNILLITLDSVRADHVSSYGYPRKTTPCLDHLAVRGAQFDCTANCTWSIPSHVSLFSGLHPLEHRKFGLYTSGNLDLDQLMAPVLSTRGYQTVGFSSNPLLSLVSLHRGFDSFVDITATVRGSIRGGDLRSLLRRYWWRMSLLASWSDYGGARTNAMVRQFLDHRDTRRPFFMFINYQETHNSWFPPRCAQQMMLDNADSYLQSLRKALQVRKIYMNGDELGGMVETSTAAAVDLYDKSLRYTDHLIEQLCTMLDDRRLLDKTIIVVTADHGENFGEHAVHGVALYNHAYSLHETVIHVPLIIHWPLRFGPGKVVGLAQLSDIAPTLLDLAGGSILPQGPDLRRLFLHDTAALRARPYVFADYVPEQVFLRRVTERLRGTPRERLVDQLVKPQAAVRGTEWKLIDGTGTSTELYNLRTDPRETHNLSGSKESAAGQAELERALTRWHQGADDTAYPWTETPVSDEEQVRIRSGLRALGYV